MNENVNLIIALSPILYVEETGIINQIALLLFRYIEPFVPHLRLYRSSPQWFFEKSFKYNCGYLLEICDYPTLFIAQNTTEFNDPERSKVFYGHFPSQSSFKAWVYID